MRCSGEVEREQRGGESGQEAVLAKPGGGERLKPQRCRKREGPSRMGHWPDVEGRITTRCS